MREPATSLAALCASMPPVVETPRFHPVYAAGKGNRVVVDVETTCLRDLITSPLVTITRKGDVL